MRVSACQAANMTENITGRRSPAAPVTGCYIPHNLPFPAGQSGLNTILLFLFLPLAAVGWVFPAVLRVMLRLRGITGNNGKPQ